MQSHFRPPSLHMWDSSPSVCRRGMTCPVQISARSVHIHRLLRIASCFLLGDFLLSIVSFKSILILIWAVQGCTRLYPDVSPPSPPPQAPTLNGTISHGGTGNRRQSSTSWSVAVMKVTPLCPTGTLCVCYDDHNFHDRGKAIHVILDA